MLETSETETGKGMPDPKPIAAGLAFSGLVQTRNTEATLRWMGFQFALGLNIAGLSGVGIWLLQQPTIPVLQFLLFACSAALAGNRVYFTVLARDGKFMGLWNEEIIELEQTNDIEGGVKIFSSPTYLDLRARKPTIQDVLRRSILAVSMVWVGYGLFIVIQLVC